MTDFARALGIYISERQIHELYDEQCFKKNILDPQKIKIDFDEAVRIYYNHFAHHTTQTTIDDVLQSVFDQYKSSKINLHSLIQTLVSVNDRFLLKTFLRIIVDDGWREIDIRLVLIGKNIRMHEIFF
jgi:hypothetical protein